MNISILCKKLTHSKNLTRSKIDSIIRLGSKKIGLEVFNFGCLTAFAFSAILVTVSCGRVSEKKSSQSSAETCLTDCFVPTDSSFSFSSKTALNDPSCTYDNVGIFDAASHLQIFFIAKCGSNPQLFTFKSSYDLNTFSSPELLSSECKAMNGSVTAAYFATGDGGFLVTEVCQNITTKHTIFLSKLSSQGVAFKKIVIDDQLPSSDELSKGYDLVWNSAALMWGVVGNKLFRKYDGSLNIVGGSQALNIDTLYYDRTAAYISVKNDDWVIIHEKLHVYSKAGALKCFGGLGFGFIFGDRLFKDRFESDDGLGNNIVDFIGCKLSASTYFGGLKFPIHGDWRHDAVFLKQPFALSASYTAVPVLYESGELLLSILNNATRPEWVVHLSVADNVKLTQSKNLFAIGNKRIYAAYVQNNAVMISLSDRDTP